MSFANKHFTLPVGGTLAALMASGVLLGSGVAFAAQAPVTADVPLDSRYYDYVEKLGAMRVADVPEFNAQPYSRLDMAKVVISAQDSKKAIPSYLESYIIEMAEEFKPEIDYLKGKSKKLNNFKVREAKVELAYYGAENYKYNYRDGINGSYQPGVSNNNGHYYGTGGNGILTLDASGSLNKDLAVGMQGRFSYDSDQSGQASLDELYAKTHIGNVSVTVGKEAMRWGADGSGNAFALSNNARPQTMLRFGLTEPHGFDNGFLKFLRKGNFSVFLSTLEKNRVQRAYDWIRRTGGEKDNMLFLGVRLEASPVKGWNLGLERLSMVKSFNKDWFTGANAENDDQWNDIAGIDTSIKLPGVHFYGSIYGEDQAGGLRCENAYSGGIYFPQLTKDGKNDLRMEMSTTNQWWYGHWTLINGWTFYGDILGDAMGRDSRRYSATINHYFDNGNVLGLSYVDQEMERYAVNPVKLRMLKLMYTAKVRKNLELSGAIGYGVMDNIEHVSGNDDKVKLATVSLKYKF